MWDILRCAIGVLLLATIGESGKQIDEDGSPTLPNYKQIGEDEVQIHQNAPYNVQILPNDGEKSIQNGSSNMLIDDNTVQNASNNMPIAGKQTQNGSSTMPIDANGVQNTTKRAKSTMNAVQLRQLRLAEVQISTGRLRGFVTSVLPPNSTTNRTAHIFKKIPFSEPPVGDLRFRRLRAKKPWRGVLNATEYGASCISTVTMKPDPLPNIDENCMYANVFADSECFEGHRKCPVLFYLFGGALAFGSATLVNDAEIVRRYAGDGVVFVSVAYRVGIFGFIDSPAAFSNLGFDDVIFALNWTRHEIGHFGGDADRVTLIGYSSGAYLAQMMAASPAVPRSLFRAAILISPLGLFGPRANRAHTVKILEHFGCPQNDSYAEVDCLRNVDALAILRAQAAFDEAAPFLFRAQYRLQTSPQLPALDEAELRRKHHKPRTILLSMTPYEVQHFDETEICAHTHPTFGYYSRDAWKACARRYLPMHARVLAARQFEEAVDAPRQLYLDYEADIMHANGFLIALANARRGGATYSACFRQRDHRTHYADRVFFDNTKHAGKVSTAEKNEADTLMDAYYPRMIKAFVKSGVPDADWRTVDTRGLGYFALEFEVSARGAVTKRPAFHHGVFNPSATKFWAFDEARVEIAARARQNISATRSSALIALDERLAIYL